MVTTSPPSLAAIMVTTSPPGLAAVYTQYVVALVRPLRSTTLEPSGAVVTSPQIGSVKMNLVGLNTSVAVFGGAVVGVVPVDSGLSLVSVAA